VNEQIDCMSNGVRLGSQFALESKQRERLELSTIVKVLMQHLTMSSREWLGLRGIDWVTLEAKQE